MTAVILGVRDIVALPAEVAPTRHWLHKLIADDYAAITDDVVLLACEAVTNAIRHSDSGCNGTLGTITLVVSAVGDVIRVEVTDAGSATKIPHLIGDDPDAVNGRGLYLIDLLSGGCWGTSDEGGRTVWFEVATRQGG